MRTAEDFSTAIQNLKKMPIYRALWEGLLSAHESKAFKISRSGTFDLARQEGGRIDVKYTHNDSKKTSFTLALPAEIDIRRKYQFPVSVMTDAEGDTTVLANLLGKGAEGAVKAELSDVWSARDLLALPDFLSLTPDSGCSSDGSSAEGSSGDVSPASVTETSRAVKVVVLAKDEERCLSVEDVIASSQAEIEGLRLFGRLHSSMEVARVGKPTKRYISMERLIPSQFGNDLGYVLENAAFKPDQKTLLRYARELVLQLKKLHDAGKIHRDVKPANVMLTADDHMKLFDFGGFLTAGEPVKYRMGTGFYATKAIGTIGAVVGTQDDIFALAATLMELLLKDPDVIFAERVPGAPFKAIFAAELRSELTSLVRESIVQWFNENFTKAQPLTVKTCEEVFVFLDKLDRLPTLSDQLNSVASAFGVDTPASMRPSFFGRGASGRAGSLLQNQTHTRRKVSSRMPPQLASFAVVDGEGDDDAYSLAALSSGQRQPFWAQLRSPVLASVDEAIAEEEEEEESSWYEQVVPQ